MNTQDEDEEEESLEDEVRRINNEAHDSLDLWQIALEIGGHNSNENY